MSITSDANFGNGRAGSFIACVKGDDSGDIGLKCQGNDVIHRTQVFSQALELNIPIQPGRQVLGHFRSRRVQPCFSTLGAQLHFPHRGQVLIESIAVRAIEGAGERLSIPPNQIHDTLLALQITTLLLDSTSWFSKQVFEDDRRAGLGWQGNAIGTHRNRLPLITDF